jgi:hypothetical protein
MKESGTGAGSGSVQLRIRMRTQEARKHTDHPDPYVDPEHWQQALEIVG